MQTKTIEKMIDLIRDHQVLYNNKLPQCRDHQARTAAWKEIAKELNVSVDDCKDTWCKLRNSYTNAIKRRDKCLKKKNKHLPPWLYESAMSFIRPFVQGYRHDYSNMEDAALSSELEPQYFDEDQNQNDGPSFNISANQRESTTAKRNDSEYSNDAESDYLAGCKTEVLYFDDDDANEEVSAEEDAIELPRKRKRVDAGLSKKILESVEDIARRIPSGQENEFDSFAKYIASSLRTLSPSNAIKAKLELQTALARIQLLDVQEKSG